MQRIIVSPLTGIAMPSTWLDTYKPASVHDRRAIPVLDYNGMADFARGHRAENDSSKEVA